MDESTTPVDIDILRALTLTEFRAGLTRAEHRRDESAALFAQYSEWFRRLEPYFRRNPRLTVDEAVSLYRIDRDAEQRTTTLASE